MPSGHIQLSPDHCLWKEQCFDPPLKEHDEATGAAVDISRQIASSPLTRRAWPRTTLFQRPHTLSNLVRILSNIGSIKSTQVINSRGLSISHTENIHSKLHIINLIVGGAASGIPHSDQAFVQETRGSHRATASRDTHPNRSIPGHTPGARRTSLGLSRLFPTNPDELANTGGTKSY
ncbi:hypothetical protein B296_00014952 [Ensete ventricosum]|uniref:Uncharacterized protein n=1 Tax=Ensete ventricosum TaxID=4639 RepID=A0A427AWL7_ENSVE|nr:hypothetical protein B296_00014952 [Ensete ventricosum]